MISVAMPIVPIHPLSESRSVGVDLSTLPQILNTPSGLAIVEIQGTVKFSAPTELRQDGAKGASFPIGKIVLPYYDQRESSEDTSWHKRVHLYVGKHQRLTGEVKKLTSPIVVLRRKTGQGEVEELEIAEVVYYKIAFAHRPEPVGGEGNG